MAKMPLTREDRYEETDQVDYAKDRSFHAVTSENQPRCGEKGRENDNESEGCGEEFYYNLGGLDPAAVLELGKVTIPELFGRAGNDPLPRLCLLETLDILLPGSRHVSHRQPLSGAYRAQQFRGWGGAGPRS
jgi:hypothetical protein